MITLEEAQKKVDEFITNHGGYWPPLSILARLTEEVGELARNVNINHGEKKKKHDADGKETKEEMADVLIVLMALANKLEINLEEALMEKIEKDKERNKGIYS